MKGKSEFEYKDCAKELSWSSAALDGTATSRAAGRKQNKNACLNLLCLPPSALQVKRLNNQSFRLSEPRLYIWSADPRLNILCIPC